MKGFATGMLFVVTLIFFVARAFEHDASWLGYVRATAEAAMVGAIADWFAVTALFKHPLGLPIPHTAIIPKRKNEIGEGLGDFVQSNFLTGDVIAGKLEEAAVAKRVGGWLSDPAQAQTVVAEVAVVVTTISEVLRDDEDVRGLVDSLIRDRLSNVAVGPILGRLIDAAMDGGHHEQIYNSALSGAANFLEDNRGVFRRRLTSESPWWVPEPIDDRVFEKIYSAVMAFLREVDDNPGHHFKRDVDVRARDLADRLRNDDRLIERAEMLKQELLNHSEFQAWTGDIWATLQRGIGDATSEPNSLVRHRLEEAVVALANRLVTDEALQSKVDAWLSSIAVYLAEHGRGEIATLIANTVESWDPQDTADRIELQVGRDLQFIRINGTLVGGLIGFLIYSVSEVLF